MKSRQAFLDHLRQELEAIDQAGLRKDERSITTPQGARVSVPERKDVLNLCANNYLGLAGHPALVETAKAALDRWGYGMASVRFICGTQSVHRELEDQLSAFLDAESTILYSSCFDAAGGLFEVLLGPEDAVISDQLNHACIIDGIRLCKARRFRYANNDMGDLEAKLKEAADARFRFIVTDGVFSMDGTIAELPVICDLADRHEALVMVDDSHAVGFMGKNGRGTHEHHEVMGKIDILTGTLGKALGEPAEATPAVERRSSISSASDRDPIFSPTPSRRSSRPPVSRFSNSWARPAISGNVCARTPPSFAPPCPMPASSSCRASIPSFP